MKTFPVFKLFLMLAVFLSMILLALSCDNGDEVLPEAQPITEEESITADPPDHDRLTGSDFVQLGELQSLKGELLTQYGEWFLESPDKIYELHLGNHEHREAINIDLQAGKKAEVKGFLYEDDIAVVTMTIDNQDYAFRTEEGTPLWAGSGYGRQRVDDDSSGEGRGRHR